MVPTILVPMLDEGTDVWRPVPAEHVRGGTYRLLYELDPTRLDENWQFLPGEIVICEERIGPAGAVQLIAVMRAV